MIKFFPHQEAALKVTDDFSNVGYFMDMGLGKTFVGAEKGSEADPQRSLWSVRNPKFRIGWITSGSSTVIPETWKPAVILTVWKI